MSTDLPPEGHSEMNTATNSGKRPPRSMTNRSYFAGMLTSNITGKYAEPSWSAFLMAAAEVADAVNDWTLDVQSQDEGDLETGCQNLFEAVHRAALALNEVWSGLVMHAPSYDFYTGESGRRLVVVEGSPMTNGEASLVDEHHVGDSRQTFSALEVSLGHHDKGGQR